MKRERDTSMTMMERMGLNDHEVPDPTTEGIFKDAVRQQKWIFDPAIKEWFTPGKFKLADKGLEVLQRVQLRDPVEEIEDTQRRLHYFMMRVLSYYKK